MRGPTVLPLFLCVILYYGLQMAHMIRPDVNTSTNRSESLQDMMRYNVQMLQREGKRRDRLFSIKSSILHQLGLAEKNNFFPINVSSSTPHIIKNRHVAHEDSVTATTSMTTTVGVPHILHPLCSSEMQERSLVFQVKNQLSQLSCRTQSTPSATLKVFKFSDPSISGTPDNLMRGNINHIAAQGLTVTVYKLHHRNKTRRTVKRLVDSQTILSNFRGWVEFDISSSFKNWCRNTRSVFLVLEAEDPFGNILDASNLFIRNQCKNESEVNDASNIPFIEIIDS